MRSARLTRPNLAATAAAPFEARDEVLVLREVLAALAERIDVLETRERLTRVPDAARSRHRSSP